MSNIDNFVTVTITKETATVSRVGFGIPAILTYHTTFPEAARLYGSLQEMIDDGFATTSREYRMVQAAFSQNPRPASVIVGRRATAPLRDVKLTPKAAVLASTAYTVTINGTAFTFTTDVTPDVAEITAGLTALIDAGAEDVDASDNTTDMDVEAADGPGGTPTAGVPFTIEFDASLWDFADATVDPGIAADLAAMRVANDDWYGLATDALGAAEIESLATAIEAAPKLYVALSQDSDIIATGSGDIASTLQSASLDRTAVLYHPRAGVEQAAIAWIAEELPRDPGSSTWKFKSLATITTYELAAGEQAFAEGKNANHYQTTAGVNVTSEGKLAGGEWIDITQFLDWLIARIKEGAFGSFAANPKVPYTDLGIQTMGGTTEDVLKEGARRGGIDPRGATPITVTLPRVVDVPAADKQTRELSWTFAASLAGAIHKAIIQGRVTV